MFIYPLQSVWESQKIVPRSEDRWSVQYVTLFVQWSRKPSSNCCQLSETEHDCPIIGIVYRQAEYKPMR